MIAAAAEPVLQPLDLERPKRMSRITPARSPQRLLAANKHANKAGHRIEQRTETIAVRCFLGKRHPEFRFCAVEFLLSEKAWR